MISENRTEARMGGYGSGRRWGGSKETTDEYRRLDVRWWHREGLPVSLAMKWPSPHRSEAGAKFSSA
jgi:hypothetical protein